MVCPEPEVFPVRVRANGAEIWFVWECADVGSCLWNAAGEIVMAEDRSGILAEVESAGRSAQLGNDCYFDIDGAREALRHRADFDPEEMVDLWNLLTERWVWIQKSFRVQMLPAPSGFLRMGWQ